MSNETVTLRVFVSGRVQGVFYRASLAEKANTLDLTGFVRNLPDGRVEFVAQGAPDSVEALIGWSREGPPMASVTDVESEALGHAESYGEFSIRF